MSKNKPIQNSTEYPKKLSSLFYYQRMGIPSRDTTHEHLGETSLIFIKCPTNNSDELIVDDVDMKFIKDSREIIPYTKFEGLSEDYYYGFRLGEQPLVEISENFAVTNTTPTLEELIHHMKTYYK